MKEWTSKKNLTDLRNVLTVLDILTGLAGDLVTDLVWGVVTGHGGDTGALQHLHQGTRALADCLTRLLRS